MVSVGFCLLCFGRGSDIEKVPRVFQDGEDLIRGRQRKGRLARTARCCRDAQAPERVCKLFCVLLGLRLGASSLQITVKTDGWGGLGDRREKRWGQLCRY